MAKVSALTLSSMTLEALRVHLLGRAGPLPPGVAAALAQDARGGARVLLRTLEAQRAEERAETRRLARLLSYEREAQALGHVHIAGVDEAGMAPLAGPVVAGAAILPDGFRPRGLDDSKKVDPALREKLALEIRTHAIAWAVGTATVEEIDQINIYHAGLLAMRRAVEALSVRPDFLLVDARRVPGVAMPQRGIIKGDALSLSIAAASILAKTHRDALLVDLDRSHPGYGFAQHKGYPTPEHLERLERLGACVIHRRTFAPVRRALALKAPGAQQELFAKERG